MPLSSNEHCSIHPLYPPRRTLTYGLRRPIIPPSHRHSPRSLDPRLPPLRIVYLGRLRRSAPMDSVSVSTSISSRRPGLIRTCRCSRSSPRHRNRDVRHRALPVPLRTVLSRGVERLGDARARRNHAHSETVDGALDVRLVDVALDLAALEGVADGVSASTGLRLGTGRSWCGLCGARVDCMRASRGWLVAGGCLLRKARAKLFVARCLSSLRISLVRLAQHPLAKSVSAPLVAV